MGNGGIFIDKRGKGKAGEKGGGARWRYELEKVRSDG